MIVEITDIPQGKNISKIKIDISFDDELETLTQITQTPRTPQINSNESVDESCLQEAKKPQPIPKIKQEKKEIPVPDEMKNIEF